MNKKFTAFLLVFVLSLSLGCFAFADNSASDLPDIDVYSWEYKLANQHNSVGVYVPEKVSFFYGQGIDARIYDDAVGLVQACQEAGNLCYICCAYRDWTYCINNAESMIKYYYDGDKCLYANSTTAPGCNEHQLGLSFDVTANQYYSAQYDSIVAPIDEEAQFSSTWEWMKEHCAEYGFIVRYPEGKEQYYGISCNPTHLRYVGREAAQYIMDNDLCLEEFLMLYGVKVNLPE